MGHLLRVSIRYWLKQPFSSFLTLLSLTGAFALALVVIMQANDMRRYGSNVPNRDRLWSTDTIVSNEGGDLVKYVGVSAKVAKAMQDRPEIEGVAASNDSSGLLKRGDERRKVEITLALLDYWRVFPKETLVGDWETALTTPDMIAISYETAITFFGSAADAMGETITLYENGIETAKRVGAVLTPYRAYDAIQQDVFHGGRQNAEMAELAEANSFVRSTILIKQGIDQDAYLENNTELFSELGARKGLGNAEFSYVPGGQTYSSRIGTFGYEQFEILAVIAAALLVLSIVNFGAYATSLVLSRQREINLRKVVGASRRDLAIQFITEAFILGLLAFCFGILLSIDVADRLSGILDNDLQVLSLQRLPELAMLFAVVLVAVMIVCIYPLRLVVRGEIGASLRASGSSVFGFGNRVRAFFVSVQALGAAGFLVFTSVVSAQSDYLLGRDRGYDGRGLYVLEFRGTGQNNKISTGSFKEQVKQVPGVLDVALSGAPLYGRNFATFNFWRTSAESQSPQPIATDVIEPKTYELLGINLVAGRIPQYKVLTEEEKKAPQKRKSILTNTTTLRALGLPEDPDEAIGQCINNYKVNKDGNPQVVCHEIVGVIKPLIRAKEQVWMQSRPFVAQPANPQQTDFYSMHLYLKLDESRLEETIPALRALYEKTWPNQFFTLVKGEDQMSDMLKQDQATRQLVSISSLVIFIIAVSGAFSLVQSTIAQRSRELALRRVLGAEPWTVRGFLMRKLGIAILPGMLIGLGLATYLSYLWLEGFVTRADPPILEGVGLVAMLIAVYTILALNGAGRVLRKLPATVLHHE